MRDNSKYYRKGQIGFSSELKESGLGKEIRSAAIDAEYERDSVYPSADTLHEWADKASCLQIALDYAQVDSRVTSRRAAFDYIPGARARLEKKLS